VSEASLDDIVRYSVIYMPLAVALLGVAVHLRRRGGERRTDGEAPPKVAPSDPPSEPPKDPPRKKKPKQRTKPGEEPRP
jgi:hypothetical protein